jgi:capsular polysaccharide biosynthesis protein
VCCFGIISHSFHSDTHVLVVLNNAESMDENGGVDSLGNEMTIGANNEDVTEETTILRKNLVMMAVTVVCCYVFHRFYFVFVLF